MEDQTKIRVIEILDKIISLSRLDFSHHLETNMSNEPLDLVSNGLNMLGEELEEIINERSFLKSEIGDLNQSLSDYQNAIDQSTVLLITDTSGIVERANAEHYMLSGYSPSEVIGNNQKLVNSGHHSKAFWKEMWETISKGGIWKGEIRNKSKTNSIYWLSYTIVPFMKQGKPHHFVAIGHNITDRKRKEVEINISHKQLLEINHSLEQFAYVTAHDLRSPLNSAMGLVNLIQQNMGDTIPPEIANHFEQLTAILEKKRKLIDGILYYSKTNTHKLRYEEIELSQLVLDAAEQFKTSSNTIFKLDEPKLGITFNRILLYQIFTNLFSNAIMHNNKPVCIIDISYKDNGDHVEIAVADNGPGIKHKNKDKIFELFENLDSKKDDSIGIGLSTVKRLITKENGKIWLDTKHKLGAKFVFTIPK